MTEDEKPQLNKTQLQMLQMISSVQRRVLAGEVTGVSFVLVTPDKLPQHGYVAGPLTAGVLAGGYLMAQADLVGFMSSSAQKVATNPVPSEKDPRQLELPL